MQYIPRDYCLQNANDLTSYIAVLQLNTGQLNCIYKYLQRRFKVLAILIKPFAQWLSRCECRCGLLRFLFIDGLPVMINLKPSRVKIIYYYYWLNNVKTKRTEKLSESPSSSGSFKKNFAKKNMIRHELSGRRSVNFTLPLS